MLQARLTRCYLDLVKDFYTELKEDRVIRCFNFVMTSLPTVVILLAPIKRKTKSSSSTVSRNQDIQEMFAAKKKEKIKKRKKKKKEKKEKEQKERRKRKRKRKKHQMLL